MSGSNTIWPISLPVSEEPESPTLTAFKFFAKSSESAGIHPPICPHDLHYVFCSNALKKGFNVPLTYTNLKGEKILVKDQFTASHLELFLLMAQTQSETRNAKSLPGSVRIFVPYTSWSRTKNKNDVPSFALQLQTGVK